MNDYYCKNCNYKIGVWQTNHKFYFQNHCYYTPSIQFLDCINCNKFIGIQCYEVCKNCFGENEIYGEKNLLNWFLKYKKTQINYLFSPCNICNKHNFRYQYWFFKELTFYK